MDIYSLTFLLFGILYFILATFAKENKKKLDFMLQAIFWILVVLAFKGW